ncbi:MAG: NAD(P)/FAD-dependent oxidoreductase [Clostridia bacterium]|nr:NAD(P)/FAD-dependent oxidoreductase [Clostridia bacterium]
MKKIVVIGGGPAGMMAAISAKENGAKVVLLEKNEKLGKKLFITGKGRCNLTNNSDIDNVLKNVVTNSKFVYSALNAFPPEKVLEYFEGYGLSLKTERGNRVFPASDKSSDVIKTFNKILFKLGVEVMLNQKVTSLITKNGVIVAIKTEKTIIYCDAVILATGGISYTLTGSTGDGFEFSKKVGHTVTKLLPALVGIETHNKLLHFNSPLQLKNVSLTVKNNDKVIYTELGELSLENYGLSGPMAITASSLINKLDFKFVSLILDLKPALNHDKLNARILREINENGYITFTELLQKLLPVKLAAYFEKTLNINPSIKISKLTAIEREKLVNLLKNLVILPKKLRKIDEAIVTSGGVSVKEINPKTMQSKLINNLFFAGEIIDIDALTGGYNIQLALSTGFVAGKYSSKE